jgi:hypothetical protein
MLSELHAAIYRAVWGVAMHGESPIIILYESILFPANDVDALFALQPYGRDDDEPQIWIRREPPPDDTDAPDPNGATVDELIALAHEVGHLTSHRNGTYVATYNRLGGQLTAEDRTAILEEEMRAWQHAATLLRAHGFDAWDAFDRKRGESLGVYIARLGIAPP